MAFYATYANNISAPFLFHHVPITDRDGMISLPLNFRLPAMIIEPQGIGSMNPSCKPLGYVLLQKMANKQPVYIPGPRTSTFLAWSSSSSPCGGVNASVEGMGILPAALKST